MNPTNHPVEQLIAETRAVFETETIMGRIEERGKGSSSFCRFERRKSCRKSLTLASRTNRCRNRSAAEVREPRHTLRHGKLADPDRGYAWIEI